jgi:hypothetical protein
VKKLELELIFVLADKIVIQDDGSDQFCVLECAMEPSAAVEAVKQDRRVFLGFAGRPAADIDMLRAEYQGSVLKAIEVVYHFTAIDIPNLLDFLPEQFPAAYHR